MWQKIECEGPPPHSRLDHTMSAVTVLRTVDGAYLLNMFFLHKLHLPFSAITNNGSGHNTPFLGYSAAFRHSYCLYFHSTKFSHIKIIVISFNINFTEEEGQKVKQTLLVVFGGMDTSGQIFDDCLAFLVK